MFMGECDCLNILRLLDKSAVKDSFGDIDCLLAVISAGEIAASGCGAAYIPMSLSSSSSSTIAAPSPLEDCLTASRATFAAISAFVNIERRDFRTC